MTIEEAVAILNEHKHRDWSDWYMAETDWVRGDGQYDVFHAFEAIAIAEKYQRDKKT